MGDKKELKGTDVLLVVGITLPIYLTLAPKEIRKELINYTSMFIGIIFLIGIAYFLYLVLIKDKIEHKRYMKALKEEQERVELARRMARRYDEKEKRED